MDDADVQLEIQFGHKHKLRSPLLWRARTLAQRLWRLAVRNLMSFRGARIAVFLVLCAVWAVATFLFELLLADGLRCGFIDALFLAVSSLSTTGLITLDFARATLATQVLTLVGFVLGALWFRTIVPVLLKMWLTKRMHGENTLAYRCMKLITTVVFAYTASFVSVMAILFAVYTSQATEVASVLVAYNVTPWYGGYFLAVSAFANAGFAPLPNSVIGFADNSGFLIYLAVFMIAGGVAFPLMLRLILLVLAKLNVQRAAAEHLLQEPREFYSFLFSFKSTMMLMGAWLTMGIVDFSLTLGLEWTDLLSGAPFQRIVQAFFTSAAIRTTGLTAVDISKFRAALVIYYIVELYLSNNPVFIEMRATTPGAKERSSFVRELEILVLRSVPLIVGAWVVLALLESGNPAVGNNTMAMLFELCSAFGTVGLSAGTPGTNWSFSGSFTIAGKLLVMLFMVIGSHRDLPLHIEPSIPRLTNLSRHTHVHTIDAPGRTFITRASGW